MTIRTERSFVALRSDATERSCLYWASLSACAVLCSCLTALWRACCAFWVTYSTASIYRKRSDAYRLGLVDIPSLLFFRRSRQTSVLCRLVRHVSQQPYFLLRSTVCPAFLRVQSRYAGGLMGSFWLRRPWSHSSMSSSSLFAALHSTYDLAPKLIFHNDVTAVDIDLKNSKKISSCDCLLMSVWSGRGKFVCSICRSNAALNEEPTTKCSCDGLLWSTLHR
jgi:hypothetical protein